MSASRVRSDGPLDVGYSFEMYSFNMFDPAERKNKSHEDITGGYGDWGNTKMFLNVKSTLKA